MRPLAAALLAAAALALAACSGDAATPEATSTPAPTAAATPEATPTPVPAAVATPEATSAPATAAIATSEATSTPAPTAVATPEATPTPAPIAASATPAPTSTLPPEQACANDIAVAEPEVNPGLVADCVALLSLMDALRGDASLDWGGGIAIEDWDGVAVSGEPLRVTGLDLRSKGLTGSIPRALRRLRLDEALFAGNALTGCVPSAFEDAATHDAASLGLPWCLRYDRLDAAGEVASAGSWAILDGNGDVLTTWEGLRSEAATLRVHETDAGGASWASEFGAVAVNDLFEWRKASDCWVRYRVTGAPVRPSGASGRWEFPIEWMTYAATGVGCTGAVGSGAVLRVDEAAPDVIPATFIDAPLRHGPWLLTPHDWEGSLEEPVPYRATESAGASVAPAASSPGVYTTDIAAARGFPLWREPALPAGWRFDHAEMGTIDSPADGYKTAYVNELGYFGTMIYVTRRAEWPYPVPMHDVTKKGSIREARMIDGHWALVKYVPPVRLLDVNYRERIEGVSTEVRIFIEPAGIIYTVVGLDRNFRGGNVEPVIEIARSLYRTPSP